MPSSLSFAKIVATATEKAWSQVYHAGNLFALVSLSSESSEHDLNALGKEMFNILESSFFSLEKKNLTTISEVITESMQEVPESVTLSACIAFSKEAILYLFLVGDGKILMKRGEKTGVLLSHTDQKGSRKIASSSGFLNHEDAVLMQTGGFVRLISTDAVIEALDSHLPNDIIEKLSTNASDLPGDASAVTLLYQGTSSPNAMTPVQEMTHEKKSASLPEEPQTSEEELSKSAGEDRVTEEASPPQEIVKQEQNAFDEEKEMRAWKTEHPEIVQENDDETDEESAPVVVTKRLPALPFTLPSRKVLFGLLAVILLVAFVLSIFVTKQQSQNSETREVFDRTYQEATAKFDEAEGLKNLNAQLAQDDYNKAAEILRDGLKQVKKGSDEEKKLLELLAKVEQNIVKAEGETVKAKPVDISESALLSLAAEKSSSFVAEEKGRYYALTSSAVLQNDDEVLENNNDWHDTAGFSVYNGNIYILDKKDGVLKFTAGADGYGKSSYFSENAPSLAQAQSMGIDGSVYILFHDGKIRKYTRGNEDSFTLSGLPSPLKDPKQIIAGTEMESIYVFDRGNSRVIQLSSDGTFKKAWKAEALASTDLIDVREDEDKIYLLKGKNLSMMSME